MITELRTASLPAAERFDRWSAMAANALVPTTLRSDHTDDFQAELRLLALGPIQIAALRYPPLESSRSAKVIRQSDPEAYQLFLHLHGRNRIIQGRRDMTGVPGELLLFDSSRPWHGWTTTDSGLVNGILVQIPRCLLPVPADRMRSLLPERLLCTGGMSGLLAGFLKQVMTDAHSYDFNDAPRLATVTVDLVAAVCAARLDAEDQLPSDIHHRCQFWRIGDFIERHLADPDLSPAVVAAAHHVSTRQLQRLCQARGLTVTGWIRRRRLERCHHDLSDPDRNHLTVQAIAAHWGFTDDSHFNRVFRAAYGMPPGELRDLARQRRSGYA